MLLHSPFPRPSSAFVGRQDELRRVAGLLPSEVLFLVYGIAGIGKSEFVYQALAAARTSERFAAAPPLLLAAQPGQQAAELLSLLQLRLRPSPPAQPPTGSIADQLAAVAQLLEARPVLLLLDDLHHVDGEIGPLLAYLARHVGRSRIFAASRTELRLPSATPPPVLIHLPPLDPVSAATLAVGLAERFGIEVASPAALAARSGGSPFWLQQVLTQLRRLPDSSTASRDPALAGLSPAARRLLLLIRLLPGRLSPTTLPGEGFSAGELDELGRHFLIEVEPSGLLVSELIWDALRPQLPEDELRAARVAAARLLRRRFDADPQHRAADAIEALRQLLLAGPAERDPAVALLQHAYPAIAAAGLDHLLLPVLSGVRDSSGPAGGPLGEPSWAVSLLLARIYLRRSDVAQAQSILAELGRQPEVARSLRYLRLLGEVDQRSGRLSQARQHFAQARTIAESAGERFQLILAQAQVASLSGAESASALLEQAQAELGGLRAVDKARWGWSRALGYLLEERLSAATELAAAIAAELVRKSGDSGAADLLALLAMPEIVARAESHQVGQARRLLDRFLHQAAGGTLRSLSTLLYRGIVHFTEGQLRAARLALDEALAALYAQHDFAPAALAAYYLARTLLGLGELESAQHTCQRALRLLRASGVVSLLGRVEVLLGQLLVESGQLAAARTQLAPLLLQPSWPARRRAAACLLLAKSSALLGDFAVAESALLEGLLRSAEVDPEDGFGWELDLELGELLSLFALPLPAPGAKLAPLLPTLANLIERCERAWHHFATGGCLYLEARAALTLATLLLVQGRPDSRARVGEALARAQALTRSGAYRLLELRAQLLEAALQQRASDQRRAILTVRQALRSTSSSEPSLERRRLEAALQALGGSPGGLGRRLPSPCDMSTELLRIGDGLARLGLGGHCRFEIIDRHGRRDADESDCQRMLAERCLVIDLSRGLISRQSGEAIAGRPLMAALLLALLGTAADGVSAERLFYDVWGGREWNPLRHRNTIHVAIARLRQLLRELLPGREVVETAQSGWRLSREIDICAIRAKSPE